MDSDRDAKQEAIRTRYIKVLIVFGGIFAFLGLCGVLVIWIVSIINPVVYSMSTPILAGSNEPVNETIYTGLRAFLLNYNATGLFIFCFVLLITQKHERKDVVNPAPY